MRSLVFVSLLTVACSQHQDGAVEVSRRDCYTCHRADYEATTNPVHPGSRPTTCWQCHTTNAWRPAADGIHPESAFPIQSGPHRDFTCLDCHDLDRGSYVDGANTDCIGCHTGAHTRAKMDDQHNEEPGYVWNDAQPSFCLTCHPRGLKEDD